MVELEYGKRYLLEMWGDTQYEAIYLGNLNKKRLKNRHTFMIFEETEEMNFPCLINCGGLGKLEKDKLKVGSVTHPKLSSLEKEHLSKLYRKYL